MSVFDLFRGFFGVPGGHYRGRRYVCGVKQHQHSCYLANVKLAEVALYAALLAHEAALSIFSSVKDKKCLLYARIATGVLKPANVLVSYAMKARSRIPTLEQR